MDKPIIIYSVKVKLTNPHNESITVNDDWDITPEGLKCKSLLFKRFTSDELRHSLNDIQFIVKKHEGMKVSGKVIGAFKTGSNIAVEKYSINNTKIVVDVSTLEGDKKTSTSDKKKRLTITEKREMCIAYHKKNGKFPSKETIVDEIPIGKFFDKLSSDGAFLKSMYDAVGEKAP